MAASTIDSPLCLSCSANSTIRIAFFADETDQHDQTDLAVDVVGQTAHPLRGQRAQHRERHAEQHDEGQHEALVLRGQRQVDEQQRQAEDDERLPARLGLLERDARPRVAHALRQRCVSPDSPSPAAPGPSSRPGAADPLIVAERNRLKWLMTDGAVVSFIVTTCSSGIIVPFCVRA